jgi:hypothetical protein
MYDFSMSVFTWVEGLSFSTFMRESDSLLAYPGFLFLHTLGMSIVAGGTMIIGFALLGVWPKQTPISPLGRLYPLIYFGFWLEVITGLSMFAKDASTYGRNPDLYWKLVCIAGGMALLALIRRRVLQVPGVDAGPVSGKAKLMAVGALVCWFGAIVTGRLIAYLNPFPVFF